VHKKNHTETENMGVLEYITLGFNLSELCHGLSKISLLDFFPKESVFKMTHPVPGGFHMVCRGFKKNC
jgi:hypothetical protein